MFKVAMPEAIDTHRDALQEFMISIRADDASHSANTLTGHLLRTYDLLKLANQSQDICNAGAVHSIFGTNAFRWKDRLEYNDSPRVAAVAGQQAARLAEIFSKIPRPGILEGGLVEFDGELIALDGPNIAVTQEEFGALCAVEAANLFDQSALSNYPNLTRLWEKLNKT